MLLTAALLLVGVTALVYYKRKRQLEAISKMVAPWVRLHTLEFTIYESIVTYNEFTVRVNLQSIWFRTYAILLSVSFFAFAMWDEFIGVPKEAKELDLMFFVVGYALFFIYGTSSIQNLNLIRYSHKLELIGAVSTSIKKMINHSLSNLDGKFFHRIIYSTQRNNWVDNLKCIQLTFDNRVYTFENEKYDAYDHEHTPDRRRPVKASEKGEMDSNSARV